VETLEEIQYLSLLYLSSTYYLHSVLDLGWGTSDPIAFPIFFFPLYFILLSFLSTPIFLF